MVFFFLLGLYIEQNSYSQNFYIDENFADSADTLCIRDTTKLIILHATNGSWPGCTDWMKRWHIGHYVINRKGHIELIVQDFRYVNHAGHSYWDGDTAVSYFSVSIELEQYKNDFTEIQLDALAWLLDSIQLKYNIPDSCVVTHSAVACFYPRDRGSGGYYRRGRKRDALEFGSKEYREKVGLGHGPTYDKEVMLGLVVPNIYQEKILYGKNYTAEEKKHYQTVYNKNLIVYAKDSICLVSIHICEIECIDIVFNCANLKNGLKFEKKIKKNHIDPFIIPKKIIIEKDKLVYSQ